VRIGQSCNCGKVVGLALKTLGMVAVSLDASPDAEMMVTVGRDMAGVLCCGLVRCVEVEVLNSRSDFSVCAKIAPATKAKRTLAQQPSF
jgi:hypothetical protein